MWRAIHLIMLVGLVLWLGVGLAFYAFIHSFGLPVGGIAFASVTGILWHRANRRWS